MSGKLFAPCVVLLIACNPDDSKIGADPAAGATAQPDGAIWSQQTAWRLSRDPVLQITGSADRVEEAPLDPVRAFATADGAYVVGDGDQNGWDALLSYDGQGKFKGRWGGAGQGPGEFRQLLRWAGRYRGDSIAAYDFVDRALEIFAPNGEFTRALKLPNVGPTARPPRGTYGASDFFIGVFRDGSVLRFERTNMDISSGVGPVYYQPELTIYDANGENPRKLGQFRTWGNWWDGQATHEYVFHPMGITVAGQDHWYHGTTDSFVVRVMDMQAREVRVLRRPVARERVTAEDREAYIQWYLARLREAREGGSAMVERAEKRLREQGHFAEYAPAFSDVIEDAAGNVWIEHFRWFPAEEVGPDPKPARWSVFDPLGRFLGEVQTPASFLVSSITHDQMIGFFKDEFDVEHVRVYGLIKP